MGKIPYFYDVTKKNYMKRNLLVRVSRKILYLFLVKSPRLRFSIYTGPVLLFLISNFVRTSRGARTWHSVVDEDEFHDVAVVYY